MKKIRGLILICVFNMCILIFGCSANNDSENITEETTINIPYTYQKTGVCASDDGWLYISDVFYSIERGGKLIHYIDAWNYKCKEVEGCYITVHNVDGTIDYVSPNMPAMCMHPEYSLELNAIEKYMDDNHMESEITVEDLSSLNIKYLDLDAIVAAYNRALKDKDNMTDKFPGYPAGLKLEYKLDDTTIFIGWFIAASDFMHLSVEIQYSDGTYLSDHIRDGIASNKELELDNVINEIKEKAIEQQSFEVREFINIEGKNNQELLEYIFQCLTDIHNNKIEY